MRDDNDSIYEPRRRDLLASLVITGLTLAVIALAGYYTPAALALVIH